jgi:hypothetical protein
LEAGAPRWKQRALYDAIKDLWALENQVQFARLSIYDAVGGVLLGSVLEGRAAANSDALQDLLQTRTLR